MKHILRRCDRSHTLVLLLAILMSGTGGLLSKPTTARADDARARQQEQLKWEQKLVFYGEEDSGEWTLRIYDKTVTERAKVKYTELWKYDVESKKWLKVDDSVQIGNVVMAADKPNNAPP